MSCYFYFVLFPLGHECGECDVIYLYVMCCSVDASVRLVCCVFDSVCELFGETIRHMFGCGCCFVLNGMDVFSVG